MFCRLKVTVLIYVTNQVKSMIMDVLQIMTFVLSWVLHLHQRNYHLYWYYLCSVALFTLLVPNFVLCLYSQFCRCYFGSWYLKTCGSLPVCLCIAGRHSLPPTENFLHVVDGSCLVKIQKPYSSQQWNLSLKGENEKKNLQHVNPSLFLSV
jgi:hypothetical protein